MRTERFNPARLNVQDRALKTGSLDPRDLDALISSFDYGRMPKVKQRNPLVGNMLEVINQPYFDTVSFAAGAAMAKSIMFQSPQGQAGKTPAQTNMILPGQLPQPQKLVVRQIRLFVINNTVPVDLANLQWNCSITFVVGKKPYLEVPAGALPAGQGFIQYSAAQLGTAPVGSTVSYSTSNGVPDPRATFILSQPVTIEAGESFSFIINPETAFNFAAAGTTLPGVGTSLQVYLDGDLYRGVS
jgi:hypothetical protein